MNQNVSVVDSSAVNEVDGCFKVFADVFGRVVTEFETLVLDVLWTDKDP